MKFASVYRTTSFDWLVKLTLPKGLGSLTCKQGRDFFMEFSKGNSHEICVGERKEHEQGAGFAKHIFSS